MPALPRNLTNFQHGLGTLEVQGTGFTSRPLWKHLLKVGKEGDPDLRRKGLAPLVWRKLIRQEEVGGAVGWEFYAFLLGSFLFLGSFSFLFAFPGFS